MKSGRVKHSLPDRATKILVQVTLEFRHLFDPDEVRSGFGTFLRAMVGLPTMDIDATTITEDGRFIGALESGVVIGGVDSYSGWLAVPGGARVPHAAVTHVGVLPTHRRQGVLSRLVAAQFDDAHKRGEIVATLRASEAVIYERFGYGVASSARSARLDRRHARLRSTVPGDDRIRLADGDATTEQLRAVIERVNSPGTVGLPAPWWELQRIRRTGGSAPIYVALHSTAAGVDDGYVVYQAEDPEHWFGSRGRTITVTEFAAATDVSRAALWRHLLSLDLVDSVVINDLALDDPIVVALEDPRAVELGPEHDETWLRLIDVEAALDARTYRDEDPVAVAVSDPLLAANSAVFQIGSKSVRRVETDPDVSVGVSALATTYLGGTRWRQLAAAGRVVEHRPGSVGRLDALFSTDRLPFAGVGF